jgi:hypothetical protein
MLVWGHQIALSPAAHPRVLVALTYLARKRSKKKRIFSKSGTNERGGYEITGRCPRVQKMLLVWL